MLTQNRHKCWHRIARNVDTELLGGDGAMHTCGQFWNSEEVLTNQSLCRILHVSHVYTFRYVNFSRDYGFIVVFTFSFQQFVRTFAAPKCTFCVVLSGMYLNFKCFEKNFFWNFSNHVLSPFLSIQNVFVCDKSIFLLGFSQTGSTYMYSLKHCQRHNGPRILSQNLNYL